MARKAPKFKVGDMVEQVTVRRFKIGIVGSYYGDPLYCEDENDPGCGEENLRLVKRAATERRSNA